MDDKDDKFREECGLMGVWGHPEASNLSYLGLYSQQHRGQEGAGVVSLARGSSGDVSFAAHRGMGLVSDVFRGFNFLALPGDASIGHVRYSTAGGATLSNVQPFSAALALGRVAVAHNGNFVNADALRARLMKEGAIFSTTSDTEVVLHLLSRAQRSEPIVEIVSSAVRELRGAFSLLILCEDRLFALRDPQGLRPLAIGELEGASIVASETCAFDLLNARYVRDVEPGELVEIRDGSALVSHRPFATVTPTPCIFEYVYFARPDSQVFGRGVYSVRRRMGVELARESPVDADLVIPVPDSGVTAAIGYASQSGIPLELGLVRNHYVGRTFIEPRQSIRDFGVKVKLNACEDVLRGKRVIVVDDSIVRGTTSRKLVRMIKAAGAKEVHMRISAPPTTDPCYYGIDTPEKEELIAAVSTVSEVCRYIEADSLAYLSVAGLYKAVESSEGNFCDACFTGRYRAGRPVDFPVAE